MGIVVLMFPGIPYRRARHLSTRAPMVFTTPSGTPGPACALLEAGLDRSSPP